MKNYIEFEKLKAIAISMGIDTKNCKNVKDLKIKIQMTKLKNIILKFKKLNEKKELERIKEEINKFVNSPNNNIKIST